MFTAEPKNLINCFVTGVAFCPPISAQASIFLVFSLATSPRVPSMVLAPRLLATVSERSPATWHLALYPSYEELHGKRQGSFVSFSSITPLAPFKDTPKVPCTLFHDLPLFSLFSAHLALPHILLPAQSSFCAYMPVTPATGLDPCGMPATCPRAPCRMSWTDAYLPYGKPCTETDGVPGHSGVKEISSSAEVVCICDLQY